MPCTSLQNVKVDSLSLEELLKHTNVMSSNRRFNIKNIDFEKIEKEKQKFGKKLSSLNKNKKEQSGLLAALHKETKTLKKKLSSISVTIYEANEGYKKTMKEYEIEKEKWLKELYQSVDNFYMNLEAAKKIEELQKIGNEKASLKKEKEKIIELINDKNLVEQEIKRNFKVISKSVKRISKAISDVNVIFFISSYEAVEITNSGDVETYITLEEYVLTGKKSVSKRAVREGVRYGEGKKWHFIVKGEAQVADESLQPIINNLINDLKNETNLYRK